MTTVDEVLTKFPDVSTREAVDLISKVDPYVWTVTRRRLKGRPLFYDVSEELASVTEKTAPIHALLRHRPFLIQPMLDTHPHKCYKKARQLGVSELSLNEVLCFLDQNPGTKWVYCVPYDAEILTRRGWRQHYEVQATDETLVLDPVTHVSKWEPILAVRTFPYSGELRAVGPFHCTDEHRWPTLKRFQRQREYRPEVVTADKLSQRHVLVRAVPHLPTPGAHSALTPRLAAILGWVVSDGHHWMTGTSPNLNTPMMEVAQSKKKYLKELEVLLGTTRKASRYSNAATVEVGERGGRVVGRTSGGNRIYGDVFTVPVKREDIDAITAAGYRSKADLPALVTRLSPDAARSMWEAMVRAEGCVSGPKRSSIFFAQNPGPVLDAFQILCALLGMAANIGARGAYVIAPGSRSARMRALYPEAKKRRYMGTVWCPQTPSGTWFMRYRGKVVFTGNTFPRDSQLKDFSVTRINEALDETRQMKRLVGVPNQVYTKRIGDSYLILRSAWESNLGEGIDADGVTLDEKDRMKDGVDIAFRESLQSSKFGHLREISTPTLPGRGVDEPFQKSCQYEWFVTCSKCGTKQPIKYPDNVIQVKDVPVGIKQLEAGTYEYLCSKERCRGMLDRLRGEWVAKYPSRTHIAGYHMPQTLAPWQDATKLMQKKIDYKFYQLWMNYCLAECSVGERVLLTDEDFDRCAAGHMWATSRSNQWSRVCVGIDWGHLNWGLVVGVNAYNNLPYLIGATVFEDDARDPLGSARRMDEWLRPFEPDVIVADAGYGKDRNAYLLKRWESKFYAAYYNPSDKHSRTFRPQFVPQSNRVLADRTISLKNACQLIKDHGIGLPVQDKMLTLLISHFRALAPLQIEEDGDIYEVIDKTGDDHLAHCLGYALMGFDYVTAGWGGFSCSWE